MKKILRKLVFGTLAALTLASQISAAGITGNRVNFRSAPSIDSQVIGRFNSGDEVSVLGVEAHDWLKVQTADAVGYVNVEYVELSCEELVAAYAGSPDEELYAIVTGSGVRLRSEPSTSGEILTKYNCGDRLVVQGYTGGWYQVTQGEYSGYICGSYVTLFPASKYERLLENSSELVCSVIDTAYSYLGIRYVYGGNYPSTGFDCSGYIKYVLAQYGIEMHRTAADMYHYDSELYISKSELVPGDLVFFSSSSESVGHVGLYLGGGFFIHASSGGGHVMISELSSSYYSSHYVGAIRVM